MFSASAYPVTIIAGQPDRRLRAKRITSTPDTKGMAKSVTMTSNLSGSFSIMR